MAPSLLSKRFCGDFDDDCGAWWTGEGYYIRYAVVAAVFAAVVLFILVGYIHAQRRMRRGLQPLAYHRWLVRRNRYPSPTGQNSYAYYAQPPTQPGPQAYPMNGWNAGPPGPQVQQGWAPPPPAYGQHVWDTPPTYAPPPGASKAAANQNVEEAPREHGEGAAGVVPPPQAYQTPARNEHVQ